jgi:hypothetical protein
MGSTSTSTAQARRRVRALRDILALIEDARLTDHQRPRLLAARRRVGPQECDGENGHAEIQTTRKYLHTLADTDQKTLDALTRIADRRR